MNHEVSAIERLEKLRVPFPANQISKLPKESKAQADERKADRNAGVSCHVCGGWHHKRAVHLDYVGHAALTDRLLDTDPEWSWEPVAFDGNGMPAYDREGGMWIRLTVCGVTRLGYGHAGEKRGGDAVKEIIGDALRNAAMRFGAALDLWHKGDLHADVEAAASDNNPKANNVTKITPMDGVWDGIAEDRAAEIRDIAAVAQEYLDGDDIAGARDYLARAGLKSADEQSAAFSCFASYEKAAMKKHKEGDAAGALAHLLRNRKKKEAA